MRTLCLFVVLSLVAACGDGGVVQPANDVGTKDVVVVDTAPNPDTAKPDVSQPDTAVEDNATPSTCEPGEGCFGESCDSNDDCLSGICTMHLGDKVCSRTCDEACPQGWSCTLVGFGGDGQYVCISKFSHLCLPCESSEGCTGDAPNACVKYDAGASFCGGSCDLETSCPSGYACQDVESADGAKSYQCVNTAGVCPCSNLAIASVLAAPCEVINEIGSCEGVRICEEAGLSECSAAEATVEECNGVDDDCNGLTDDGTCDDGNDCTVDTCQGEGGCTYESLTEGECLDGDACTIADHCEEGVCVGQAVDCADENPCTIDSCDGLGGCQHESVVAVCDDGDPCTLGDICSEGACEGSATLICDDGNACTDDSCGEAGCLFQANVAGCDDGNACTSGDTCADGVCKGAQLACDDGNLCTTDSCDLESGCVTSDNNQPCDDGDTCTLGDACVDGACGAGANALTCEDGNPCTDDACDGNLGCVFSPNAGDCDDKNSCTTADTCVEGACIGSGSLACDDGNACTVDGCLPDGGCSHTAAPGACDDGDACTVNDSCADGTCESGLSLSCDDGNPCTDESCQGGDCVFTDNAADCDDGNACTTSSACADGLCSGTASLNCDDGNVCTSDACDLAIGCVNANNDQPCTDGEVCSVADQCEAGTCVAGEPLVCDDGSLCTEDICQEGVGCVFTQILFPCCAGGTEACGDVCVDTLTDPKNCGGCDIQCALGESCEAGACESSCELGEELCDGFCKDTSSDVLHCGQCGDACPTAPNMVTSCTESECELVCAQGYADCNANVDDGCEINLTNDLSNCGACDKLCPANVPNGNGECKAATCLLSCDLGYDDCDGQLETGCEANLLESPSHCATCGNACEEGFFCSGGECTDPGPTSFDVLDSKDVSFQGNNYLLLKVSLKSTTSVSENWCFEYRNLCKSYGYAPTGCGPAHNDGGYLECKSKYGSVAPDNSLNCNASGGVQQIASQNGFADATGQNSFAFHYCGEGICLKEMCGTVHCHTALSYIDSSKPHGYTVCIK